jgi:hypothetical protein
MVVHVGFGKNNCFYENLHAGFGKTNCFYENLHVSFNKNKSFHFTVLARTRYNIIKMKNILNKMTGRNIHGVFLSPSLTGRISCNSQVFRGERRVRKEHIPIIAKLLQGKLQLLFLSHKIDYFIPG